MLFPSICDVIRNLGGMWRMLFPEKYATYLDLPQNFEPDVGGKFYVLEMRRIARELEARGSAGRSIRARSASASRARNERRASLAELDALRAKGALARAARARRTSIVRAGAVLETAEAHPRCCDEFVDAVGRRAARPVDNVRVVLVGQLLRAAAPRADPRAREGRLRHRRRRLSSSASG